jgi:hypothetical protein
MPRTTASSGRIIVERDSGTTAAFFPAVFNCEFIEREDRADEDAHTMLELNAEKVRELEAAYDKAVAGGFVEFDFRGHALLVSYAKYLIEYAKKRLGMS